MIIPGSGPKPAQCMFIGERAGKEESKYRKVFVGKSGRELNRYLSNEGIQRDDCYCTNIVKDYKEGDPDPTQEEIERDACLLDKELAEVQPQFIGLIGRFAARRFLGDIDMEWAHGLAFTQNFYPGISIPAETVYMPIYHPAFGLHNPQVTPLIQDDFHQFVRLVRGELDLTPRVDLYPNPEYKELAMLSAGLNFCGSNVYVDTEGTVDKPWGLSYALWPGKAWVIRAENKRALGTFNNAIQQATVVMHNALYDIPVLAAMGVHVNKFTDTMIKAHHLQVEPQGLKPLARRHASAEQQDYSELVHEAGYQKALDYLERVMELANG